MKCLLRNLLAKEVLKSIHIFERLYYNETSNVLFFSTHGVDSYLNVISEILPPNDIQGASTADPITQIYHITYQ